MTHWFAMGGAPMYYILGVLWLVGPFCLLVLGMAAASLPIPTLRVFAKVGGALALVASGIPLLVGIIGWQVGCYRVDTAVEFASPEYKELIRERGYEEAAVPLMFGLAATILLLLPAGGAVALVAAAPGPAEEP